MSQPAQKLSSPEPTSEPAPEHKIRFGRVEVAIWKRQGESGTPWYSTSISRSYKDKDDQSDKKQGDEKQGNEKDGQQGSKQGEQKDKQPGDQLRRCGSLRSPKCRPGFQARGDAETSHNARKSCTLTSTAKAALRG